MYTHIYIYIYTNAFSVIVVSLNWRSDEIPQVYRNPQLRATSTLR